MKSYYVKSGVASAATALLALCLLTACGKENEDGPIDLARSAMLHGETSTALIHVQNLLRDEPENVEARLLRADISLELDDGALAEKDLLRARDLGVPPGDVVVRLGQAMLLQSAFSRVIADIHPGAAKDPQARKEILLIRGNAYLGMERLDSAEQAFRDVEKADANSPHALVGLARVAFARGHAELALGFLSRALASAPDDVDILRAYARFHLEAGNLELARGAFLDALAAEPVEEIRQDSFATISGLFETHMRLGETAEARALADQALANEPGHPLAHYLLGEHALRTGQKEAAAEHLQNTLSSFPFHLGALSQLGALSLEEGKLDLAELYLRQALALDENNPGLRMQLARAMLLRREGETALEVLTPIMAGSDEVPEILALAGSATRLSRDHTGWLDYFEQAAAAEPDNPDWQFELARAYLAAGLPDRCLEVLARIQKSEKIANAHDRLSLEAHRRSGDFAAALPLAQQLRERNSDNIEIDLLAGEVHLEAGDLVEARAVMEQALEAEPASPSVLLFAGRVEIRAGNLDGAEQYFRSAYTLQPDNLKVVSSMAKLAQRNGDNAQAIELLKAARITNPDSLMPLVGLVSLYLQEDDVSRAHETARQATVLRSDDPRALLALGATQMRREEYREAIETLQQASIQARDAALVQFALAQAYQAAGKPNDALFAIQRAVRLAPRKTLYALAAIELNLSFEQIDEAERLARAVIEIDSGNADAYRLLGETLLKRGEYADAAKAFGTAAQLRPDEDMVIRQFRAMVRTGSVNAFEVLADWLVTNPGHWRVRQTLAGVLHYNGEIAAAIEHYNRILEAEPDNVLVLNNLAMAYDVRGDDRSLEMAERAHRLSPHIGNFTDTLGWLLVKSGETERGNALLRKAAQQLPAVPEVRYHLAAGLAQSGEVEEARVLLSELIESAEPFDGLADARALLDTL